MTTATAFAYDPSNEVEHSSADGVHRVTYANGATYEGAMRDARWEGRGTVRLPNGDVYEGDFQQAYRQGTGTYTFADGSAYRGTWQRGHRVGHGVIAFGNGDKYSGEVDNNTMHGSGTYQFFAGDVYVGEFENGVMQGSGQYTSAGGDTYRGLFKNGVMHGKGKLAMSDESVWEGLFAKGQRVHGMRVVGKTIVEEKWDNGRIVACRHLYDKSDDLAYDDDATQSSEATPRARVPSAQRPMATFGEAVPLRPIAQLEFFRPAAPRATDELRLTRSLGVHRVQTAVALEAAENDVKKLKNMLTSQMERTETSTLEADALRKEVERLQRRVSSLQRANQLATATKTTSEQQRRDAEERLAEANDRLQRTLAQNEQLREQNNAMHDEAAALRQQVDRARAHADNELLERVHHQQRVLQSVRKELLELRQTHEMALAARANTAAVVQRSPRPTRPEVTPESTIESAAAVLRDLAIDTTLSKSSRRMQIAVESLIKGAAEVHKSFRALELAQAVDAGQLEEVLTVPTLPDEEAELRRMTEHLIVKLRVEHTARRAAEQRAERVERASAELRRMRVHLDSELTHARDTIRSQQNEMAAMTRQYELHRNSNKPGMRSATTPQQDYNKVVTDLKQLKVRVEKQRLQARREKEAMMLCIAALRRRLLVYGDTGDVSDELVRGYEVQTLLQRREREGRIEFLVRWSGGFPDSWEDIEHVHPSLIEAFTHRLMVSKRSSAAVVARPANRAALKAEEEEAQKQVDWSERLRPVPLENENRDLLDFEVSDDDDDDDGAGENDGDAADESARSDAAAEAPLDESTPNGSARKRRGPATVEEA